MEYLQKASTIWIEDIQHTLGILQQNFEKAEEEFKKLSTEFGKCQIRSHDIFTNINEFTNLLEEFRNNQF